MGALKDWMEFGPWKNFRQALSHYITLSRIFCMYWKLFLFFTAAQRLVLGYCRFFRFISRPFDFWLWKPHYFVFLFSPPFAFLVICLLTLNSIACLKNVPVTLLAVFNKFPLHNYISYIVLIIPLVYIGTTSINSHHFQKWG